MMKFHIVNPIRTDALTPVPVDVAELPNRVKDYEDRGETARRYPIENEQLLGRPWSTVQRLAEELALLIPDFDLDAGPCRGLLIEEDGSFWLFRIGKDGSENEEPTRTSIRQANIG